MRLPRTMVAALGLAFGATTLFAATRSVSMADLRFAFGRVDVWWVSASLLAYAVALPMRGFRWALLLNQISPQRQVAVVEATIVGFAANYLLPARLGEVFRADYLKRISGLSRTAAIGSIGVERTVDGLTVVGLLALGLIWSGIGANFAHGTIRSMVLLGVLTFGGVAFFLGAARYSYSWLAASEHRIFRYAAAFVEGVRGFNAQSAIPFVMLTAVIWMLELVALGAMLRAFGGTSSLAQLIVLASSLTLSTLVPTAPGFLGSLQLVGGILMESFGGGRALGIAVTTGMQVFCYLPIALVGVGFGAVRWQRLLANRSLHERGNYSMKG